jgi:acyl-CoA thioester hydrolase
MEQEAFFQMTEIPDDDALLDVWHETTLRVRYADTDQMGVVYHANYLIWFEIGRTEFCRARGFSYRDMEADGNAFLVVAESYCRYKAPARYDDELLVRTHVTELRRRSVRFGYEIVRLADDHIIAEGETGHVVTDSHGRVISMPDIYRQLLSSKPVAAGSASPALSIPPRGGRVPEEGAP